MADHLASSESGAVTQSFGPISIDMTFSQLAVISASLILLSAAGRIVASYVMIRRKTAIAAAWKHSLVAGFLNSTFEFQSSKKRGDILETAGRHASGGATVLDTMANGLNAVFSALVFLVAAFVLDPVVATSLLIGGSLLLVLTRPASRRVRKLSSSLRRSEVDLGDRLDEMVMASRDVKLFGAEEEFARSADAFAEEAMLLDRKVSLTGRAVPIFFQSVGLVMLLVALVIASQAGEADLTAMGAAAILLLRGISYGQQLSTFQQNLSRSIPYVESVLTRLDEYETHTEQFGPLPIEQVESIEFDGVGYHYEPDSLPAVDDLSITIKETGITGLVGPSGSGKSTVAQLILRLRQPSAGTVLVNGVDSMEYDVHDWQRSVAFVPQEAQLIHGTVSENIRYFRDWITDEQVESAAEAVGMTEAIRALPEGFETQIGPTVRDFSGGQKQRIGIARALIGRPTLFVLDEPTSALDEESEMWVMKAVSDLRRTAIVLMITHRHSTMDYCDNLIRLRDGRVVG